MSRLHRCLSERVLLSLLNREGSLAQQNHLVSCEACATKYRQLESDLKAISQTLHADPPPDFAWQHLQSISVRWSRLAAALAVVLVLVSGGLSMWSSPLRLRARGTITPETRSILDEFPSNPFLLSEAIAKELGIEESDYFDAATDWETEWPLEWYDLSPGG